MKTPQQTKTVSGINKSAPVPPQPTSPLGIFFHYIYNFFYTIAQIIYAYILTPIYNIFSMIFSFVIFLLMSRPMG